LPDLLVRQIGGGHVGAGHTFLDCLEEILIFERVPGSSIPQVGTTPTFSPGTMAAGAGICEQLAALRDCGRVTKSGVFAFLALVFPVLRK
jgi:hypothetical protein